MNGALDELAADREVLVLVVRGAGERAFSAGSDIREFPGYLRGGNVVEKKLRHENETCVKLDSFAKPTIAALNGPAYGGGLELAVCCDLIVADETAKLSLPEIKLGVFPGSGGHGAGNKADWSSARQGNDVSGRTYFRHTGA